MAGVVAVGQEPPVVDLDLIASEHPGETQHVCVTSPIAGEHVVGRTGRIKLPSCRTAGENPDTGAKSISAVEALDLDCKWKVVGIGSRSHDGGQNAHRVVFGAGKLGKLVELAGRQRADDRASLVNDIARDRRGEVMTDIA